MNSPNPMTDLLGRGAEVNCVDNLDRIPLHAAVYGCRQSIDVYRLGVHAFKWLRGSSSIGVLVHRVP